MVASTLAALVIYENVCSSQGSEATRPKEVSDLMAKLSGFLFVTKKRKN
jgi:hypothetical protein